MRGEPENSFGEARLEARVFKDVLVDEIGSADNKLPVIAKMFPRMAFSRPNDSSEPLKRLTAQFTLTAKWVNNEVAWSPDKTFVCFGEKPKCVHTVVCNHMQVLESITLNGTVPQLRGRSWG